MTETPPPPHEPDPLEADAPRVDRGPGAIDPAAPLDPVDEAASATIDGLVPDADVSAIDPDLLDDRVRELTGVTTRLSEPVRPPDAAIVDAHIAAALAAVPAAAPESPLDPPAVEHRPAPAVASLAERRRRPSAGRWLAVAAAIAVVALAIPLVRSLSSSSTASHDTATATASAASSERAPSTTASGGQRATAQSDGFGGASTTTTAAPTLNTATATSGSDLGPVDTPQALTALVEGAVPPAPQPTTTFGPAVDQASTTTIAPSTRTLSCEPSVRAGHPDLGALRYTATATYQSVPVQVAVYDVADTTAASGRLIVTKADDCQVLLDQLLP